MGPNNSNTTANGDWRDGFLFVGNQLILDFVNTLPVIDGQPIELLPDAHALARWLVAAGLCVPSLIDDWKALPSKSSTKEPYVSKLIFSRGPSAFAIRSKVHVSQLGGPSSSDGLSTAETRGCLDPIFAASSSWLMPR